MTCINSSSRRPRQRTCARRCLGPHPRGGYSRGVRFLTRFEKAVWRVVFVTVPRLAIIVHRADSAIVDFGTALREVADRFVHVAVIVAVQWVATTIGTVVGGS